MKSSQKSRVFKASNNISATMHWKERLKNLEFQPMFGASYSANSKGANKINFVINNGSLEKLVKMASTAEAKYIVLISTLAVQLNKYYGCLDTLVFSSSPSASKNIVPLRISLNPEMTFQQLLLSSKPWIIKDFEYGDYPFSKIVEASDGNISECPKIGFVLEGLQELSSVDWLDFDLLYRVEIEEEISLKLEYNPEKFTLEVIQEMASRYFFILEKLLAEPATKIQSIKLLSKEEEYKILNEFNNTNKPYPENETIVGLFEQMAKRVPDNKAIQFGDKNLTYSELQVKINRIASYLQKEFKVSKGDLVGLILERELDLIPIIFAILKVGAVYVPVNPNFPKERIKTIGEDAKFKVVISRGSLSTKDTLSASEFIDLNKVEVTIENYSTVVKDCKLSSSDLAYIIFTSGSTGKPKGVMIEHAAVVNRICWMQNKYPIGGTDTLIQKTPITFDVSIWELFWWSFTGASLFVPKPSVEKDPQKLMEKIIKQKITVIHFVPSMLSTFLRFISKRQIGQDLSGVKYVFASGEALKPNHVKLFKKCFSPNTKLINLYGPTEATVDVSHYECKRNMEYSNVPIGKPIQNIKLYIVNKEYQLLPQGISGELVIEGIGLARGYLDKEQLTSTRFIQSSFGLKERIYKTGDLARWLPKGTIEFLGRMDNQVKIRGYRIELGEIESNLLKYHSIQECTVDVRGNDEEKYLVAYYVSKMKISDDELRGYLKNFLPEYMVPAFFVPLEKFPINSNGKLDRSSLPKPDIPKEEVIIPPSNEVERKVLAVWAQVLDFGKSEISVKSNFFHLGGHSLKIIEIINRIDEEFDVMVPFNDFFENPTVELLSKLIKTKLWLQGKSKSERTNKKITI